MPAAFGSEPPRGAGLPAARNISGPPRGPASSLVYHSGAIGDFVTTIPAFHAWRRRHPAERIVLLGRPQIAALAEGLGLFDEVWDAGSPRFSGLFGGSPPPSLRLDGFSSALLFCSTSSALPSGLARAGAHGIVRQDPFPPALSPACAVNDAAPRVHVIDWHLSLFADLEPGEIRVPALFIRSAAASHTRAGKIAALHPGSGSLRKDWPMEKFEDAARRLGARGFSILWILGPAEESRELRPGAGEILRGRSLHEIAAELSACSLFLGNDSGIAHVAAAVRCPAVVLFGPTDPAVWSPRGGKVRVLQAQDGNIESIGIDDVMKSCSEAVAERG